MAARFGFLIVLALALAVAALAVRPPAPAGLEATPTGFSAERALADERQIAREPHPTGSTANRAVRDYLIRRLGDLGLDVQVQSAEPVRAQDVGWAAGARVQNLIATLPGRNPGAPAVVLMSHYDSAVGSPGAADDAAGVAASLEVVRALQAEGLPRERDLVLVITDAEEQGLLGAQAYFDAVQRPQIGAVINLETRGASGRAFMFQTGPANGELMALYAREVRQPATTSLAALLYSILPNDTDFTHALGAGLTGYNIAFIDEPFHYHAVTSTPETLNPASLQHMGGQALDLSRALVRADPLPQAAPDAVFSDVFGLFTLMYPAWVGWILVIVLAALLAGLIARAPKSEGARWKSTLIGVGAGIATALLGAAFARLMLVITGASADFVAIRPLLGRLAWFEVALFLAALAASLLIGRVAVRGWRKHAAAAPEGVALGVLSLGAGLTLALQLLAPAAALLTAWPTLIGASALLLERRLGAGGRWAALALATIGLAFAFTLIHAFFLGVGTTMPDAIGALTLVAVLCVAPMWSRIAARPWALTIALVCLVMATAVTVWLRLDPQQSSEHPQFNQVLYISEPGVGARVVSPMPELDTWSRRVLNSQDGEITRGAEPALWLDRVDVAAAADVDAQPVQVRQARTQDGRIEVRIDTPQSARELRLTLVAEQTPTSVSLQGQAIQPAPPGEPTRIRWSDPYGGVTLVVQPAPGDTVRLRWAVLSDGWPAGATPLPPRRVDQAPWGASDSLVVVGEAMLSGETSN